MKTIKRILALVVVLMAFACCAGVASAQGSEVVTDAALQQIIKDTSAEVAAADMKIDVNGMLACYGAGCGGCGGGGGGTDLFALIFGSINAITTTITTSIVSITGGWWSRCCRVTCC